MTIEDMRTRAAQLALLIPRVDAEIDRHIERLDGSLMPDGVGAWNAGLSRRLEYSRRLTAEETWLHRQLTPAP